MLIMTQRECAEKVAQMAIDCLTLRGIENTQAGHCAGWVREVVERVHPAIFHHPRGLDARAAFEWYVAKGLLIPRRRGSVPGDLLFKVGGGHGLHGHVGVRIAGNVVAENSSVHGIGDDDARGVRSLKAYGASYMIIRPRWQKKP
jgi:hypothetical protein